jgi:hypothetical protein
MILWRLSVLSTDLVAGMSGDYTLSLKVLEELCRLCPNAVINKNPLFQKERFFIPKHEYLTGVPDDFRRRDKGSFR